MKFHLYSAISTLAVLLLWMPACTPAALAQKRKVMNRPYIDQRRFHYGFLAGLHMQDMELTHNGFSDAAGNQWSAEVSRYEPGFSVGILGELYLTRHVALRLIPTMHFGTKDVTFRNHLNGERQYQSVKSTYISLPLDVKFSAERFNNYRPYAMVGLNPVLDLTVKQQRQLLLKRFDVFIEAGFGCDFYSPWFKFIPELKFCLGLTNIIQKNRSDITDPSQLIFTDGIDKGRAKMIVLTFYFE
jgi:hypothetical protein